MTVEEARAAIAGADSDADQVELLSALAAALVGRYESQGEVSDLVEAVRLSSTAVDAAEAGHNRSALLANLGGRLRMLSARTGRVDLLTLSVSVGREAAKTVAPDDLHRPQILSNLGIAVRALAEQTAEEALAFEAVDLARRAVEACGGNTPDRPLYLSNLMIALRGLGEHTGQADLLAQAVEAGRRAVAEARPDDPDRLLYLTNLGLGLRSLFRWTQDSGLLDEAVAVGRRAVAATADDSPDLHGRLTNLGGSLFALYGHTRQLESLHEAIEVYRRALAATPEAHAGRAGHMSNLGVVLRTLGERTGGLAELSESVRWGWAAAEAASDRRRWISALSNLGLNLQALAERTGAMDIWADAATVARQTVEEAAESGLATTQYLSNLSGILLSGFELCADLDLLTESVELGRNVVAATPVDDLERANRTANLGKSLLALAERTGQAEPLQEAVRFCRQAVEATADDAAELPGRLAAFAAALFEKATATGRRRTLAQSVTIQRQAVRAWLPDSWGLPAQLSNLQVMLCALHEDGGPPDTLSEAEQVCREAFAICPPDHPDRTTHLSNLARVLARRFEETGTLSLLLEAERRMREAVEAAASDDEDRCSGLSDLSTLLRSRFEQSGDVAFLHEAVAASREAADGLPPGSPSRPAALSNASAAKRALFERTGDPDSLSDAIVLGRRAVAEAAAEHQDRPGILSNLAGALRTDFEHSGLSESLLEALVVGREAVAASARSPRRGIYLSNLGITLLTLFEHTGDVEPLREAADVGRRAVRAAPTGSPHRAGYLSNLGIVLRSLFEATGEEAALDEAVRTGRQAVRCVERSGRPMYLSNMSIALRLRGETTGHRRFLAQALEAAREAVAATPQDHPDRAMFLNNLGACLHTVADRATSRSKREQLVAEAATCFAQAGSSALAGLRTRIHGHRSMAALPLPGVDGPARRLAAVEAAVELLPLVSSQGLPRNDRERGVGRLAGLPAQAAAVAVTAGDLERAVELLEQTRGLLVVDTLDARSGEPARLRAANPVLADEYDAMRRRIEFLDTADSGAVGSEYPATAGRPAGAERREVDVAWRGLLERIRAVDELDDFLCRDRIATLVGVAADGPIVYIYTDPIRSDALILRDAANPRATLVPLPKLTRAEAVRQTERLLAARFAAEDPDSTAEEFRASQDTILEILEWMWDVITAPILEALDHTATPRSGAWPRLWWCPVGILAYLPLHAAGHHGGAVAVQPSEARPTVLDRVMSSYTTTARTLSHVRARPKPTGPARTLIIEAADLDGAVPLPGVAREVLKLADLVPGALIARQPTPADVLENLPGCAVVHFTCHGEADWADPAGSRLVLDSARNARLDVRNVAALDLQGAELAYLSACETTSTRPDLTDEAVHMTAAFQLAGFRHVVGTLWPINDATAGIVARNVYTVLTDRGSTAPDVTATARAVHGATRNLRDAFPRMPILWGALVHTGP